MPEQTRIRWSCLVGAGLLLAVICGIVREGYIGSTPSISPRDFPGRPVSDTPALTSEAPRATSETPRDAEGAFSPNDAHPLSDPRGAQGGKTIRFVSKDEYERLISALFLLFLRTAEENPGHESVRGPASPDDGEDLPGNLAGERPEIRRYYRELLREKQRWDHHRDEKYAGVLESRIEPARTRIRNLDLDYEGNMEYFEELEAALELHNRLVRDVRIFHDEVRFQKARSGARRPYRLFDLKFKLAPFAREAALSDAMQRAMSSLSVGMYQEEASEVIERLCDELLKPVDNLHARRARSDGSPASVRYNYNTYIVFTRKLMNYSDALLRQSSIHLMASSRGELDFLNRRLSESLGRLYEIGQNGVIRSDYLDLETLERDMHSL